MIVEFTSLTGGQTEQTEQTEQGKSKGSLLSEEQETIRAASRAEQEEKHRQMKNTESPNRIQ